MHRNPGVITLKVIQSQSEIRVHGWSSQAMQLLFKQGAKHKNKSLLCISVSTTSEDPQDWANKYDQELIKK